MAMLTDDWQPLGASGWGLAKGEMKARVQDWDFQPHPPPPGWQEGLKVKLIMNKANGLISRACVMKPPWKPQGTQPRELLYSCTVEAGRGGVPWVGVELRAPPHSSPRASLIRILCSVLSDKPPSMFP